MSAPTHTDTPTPHAYTYINATFVRVITYTNMLAPKYLYIIEPKRSPPSAEGKLLDYEIVVSEFELQLRYPVHFQSSTFGKGMNPFITSAMG